MANPTDGGGAAGGAGAGRGRAAQSRGTPAPGANPAHAASLDGSRQGRSDQVIQHTSLLSLADHDSTNLVSHSLGAKSGDKRIKPPLLVNPIFDDCTMH